MSIRNIIKDRCADRVLFPIDPFLEGDPIIREVYVSDKIQNMLFFEANKDKAWAVAKATLDNIVSGGVLSVGVLAHRHKSEHAMALLEPKDEGVWAIRATKPKPGIRILGQFAEKDLFIALTWGERKELGEFGSQAWKQLIRNCKAQWRGLFPSYAPLKTEDENEYISNIICS